MSKEASQHFSNSSTSCGQNTDDDDDNNNKDNKESVVLDLLVISELPKSDGWKKQGITLYQNCWFPSNLLPNVIAFQKNFKAKYEDIIMASFPKSGTTWLKSLLFSILNRHKYYYNNNNHNNDNENPLLTTISHHLVPAFEFQFYSNYPENVHDLDTMPSPRLVSTHIPYASLPDSINKFSKSRIIYISRNPLDVIVSFWHFANGHPERLSREWTVEYFVDMFCKGDITFGPYWEHVLGYWKASLARPENVLFLKYEDLKKDSVGQLKKIAKFVGMPFSQEEENDGVVEQILEMCSLSKLKNLDVNKYGEVRPNIHNKIFFRKGQVGDWINHLTPSMVERVKNIIIEKLNDSGLSFKL
ncbi:cytosolic sulfotransferase 5-like [Cannabis sativa]|uniref:cytosolic sulfotransferase 5-like n=1 Tax=Cannabis sativa TaxID=3483 RepID=UPI0029CA6006|nr:cytosolic sulfotransferase 5-like [Cannabis sativa]